MWFHYRFHLLSTRREVAAGVVLGAREEEITAAVRYENGQNVFQQTDGGGRRQVVEERMCAKK